MTPNYYYLNQLKNIEYFWRKELNYYVKRKPEILKKTHIFLKISAHYDDKEYKCYFNNDIMNSEKRLQFKITRCQDLILEWDNFIKEFLEEWDKECVDSDEEEEELPSLYYGTLYEHYKEIQ